MAKKEKQFRNSHAVSACFRNAGPMGKGAARPIIPEGYDTEDFCPQCSNQFMEPKEWLRGECNACNNLAASEAAYDASIGK